MARSQIGSEWHAQTLGGAPYKDLPSRTIAAGSLVIVGWRFEGVAPPKISSVTDTAGATYTVVGSEYGTNPTVGIAYSYNHPGQASNVIRVQFTAGDVSYCEVYGIEFDGSDTTNPLDTSGTQNGTSFSLTYTASSAGLAVAMCGNFSTAGNTPTAPASLIAMQSYSSFFKRTHSAGSNTIAAAVGSGNTNTLVAVFKDTASAPVLSSPTATATGPTQATIGVTSDTAPTTTAISYQILPAATAAPDATTIVGAPTGTITTGSAGALTLPITGLATNTAVKAHFAQGTTSNVVSTASFTPSTLAIAGTALSAQTVVTGAALSWTGATPESLVTNTGNGSGGWVITSGNSGSGITGINASTGVLSGTAATVGSYTITLTRSDGSTVPGAQTVTKTVSLTVSASGDTTPPTMSAASVTGGTLSATGSITSNEAGTLWWKMDGSATATDPGAGSETGAGWTSQSMTASANAVNFGTQPAGLRYGHFLGIDAAGNRAAVVNASDTVLAGAVYGFDLHTAAGCVFGAIAGALTGISREVGVSYKVAVYNASTRALIFESSVMSTDSNGRLARVTNASVTAGVTYDLVAKRQSDGAVAAFRLAAT